MLLLFWRAGVPTEGTIALSVRPSSALTVAHGGLGVSVASARARGASSGFPTEAFFFQTLAARASARLALSGVRGVTSPVQLAASSSLSVPSGIGGRTADQVLTAVARATFLGERAAVAGAADLQGQVTLVVAVGQAGHLALVRVAGHVLAEVIGVHYLVPQIPMQQLAPIDLGTAYRGDTMILPIWAALTREGEPYDLGDGVLHFTAKEDLALPDAAPHVIQCSTEDGGITIQDPPELGLYRVRIESVETQALLSDTVFTFDVQLHTDAANVYTIRRGLLTVVRDVTRASS